MENHLDKFNLKIAPHLTRNNFATIVSEYVEEHTLDESLRELIISRKEELFDLASDGLANWETRLDAAELLSLFGYYPMKLLNLALEANTQETMFLSMEKYGFESSTITRNTLKNAKPKLKTKALLALINPKRKAEQKIDFTQPISWILKNYDLNRSEKVILRYCQ